MASSLIDSLSGDFEPEQYTDRYREALESLIEAKVAGREVVAPAQEQGDGGAVVDLMAALRASVDAAKRSRSADATPEAGAEADGAEATDVSPEAAPAKSRSGKRGSKSGSGDKPDAGEKGAAKGAAASPKRKSPRKSA